MMHGPANVKEHMEYLRFDGKIILKWIFKNWDGGMDWIYLAQGRDNEPFGSVKCGEFFFFFLT